jgi:hypothetical protein
MTCVCDPPIGLFVHGVLPDSSVPTGQGLSCICGHERRHSTGSDPGPASARRPVACFSALGDDDIDPDPVDAFVDITDIVRLAADFGGTCLP